MRDRARQVDVGLGRRMGEHHQGQRHEHARAQHADQREDRVGLRHVAGRHGREGEHRHRRVAEAEAEAVQDVAPHHALERDLHVEAPHHRAGEGLDRQADEQAEPGVEARELGHDAEGGEVAQPARGDQVADRRLGIALQFLQERREQDHRRVLQHAHDQREDDADRRSCGRGTSLGSNKGARDVSRVDREHGEEHAGQARIR